ncbi:uncharacterized protein [Dermacentor albipictus]|uniref:uncharacterized protein isoform X1 n=1 Tax=Dermacentor albipictus TaxID=60249 RepID=UPI0031FD594D
MFWMRRPLSARQMWNHRRSDCAFFAQKPQQLSHEMRFREALSRAGYALEYSDAHLEETLRKFATGLVDPRAFSSAVVLDPVLKARSLEGFLVDSVRDLFYGTASRHREVGSLTHLFTRIRRKGVSPLEHTESTRTNLKRLISVAQMQQIAQELHDDIVTTAPDDSADAKAIGSANKLNTMLSDALLTLAFKTVTDTADVRVLELFSRSLERFSSSYFDDKEKTDAADGTPIMQQWSRYQVYNTEPLANAFECSQLLAGANAEERSAARQCGNDLALAIQAIKELDLFLNRERHGPLGDPRSLPAVLANAGSNKASEVRRQCGGPRSEADAEKSQREQRCIVDGMIGVIQGLTDGVLGYVADCEASEASEALRDIASALRIEHVITPT